MTYAGTLGQLAPGAPLTVTTIPEGDAGATATLRHMRRLARAALLEPTVLQRAADIVRGVPPFPDAQVPVIRDWLVTHFSFLRDPDGVELIRTPSHLLAEIERRGGAQGDCDDVAVLGAALGLAVGIPARFVAAGFRGRHGPLSHVYTELRTRGGWRELDVTKPAQMPPDFQPSRLQVEAV